MIRCVSKLVFRLYNETGRQKRESCDFSGVKILNEILYSLFLDETLYGYSRIDEDLKSKTGCGCALVTLMPFPDLERVYRPDEFYKMNEELSKKHACKTNQIKKYLDECRIKYAAPPAAPNNDGEYRADFSYKWAAVHAGLGFIGKNDVFVHYKYGQRLRISCLLFDMDAPVYRGTVESKCGDCDRCVKACPYDCLSGKEWHGGIRREELIDYRRCAAKSKHDGPGQKRSCCYCMMACQWHKVSDMTG